VQFERSFPRLTLSAALLFLASACSDAGAPSAPESPRAATSGLASDTASTGGTGTTSGIPASSITLTVGVGSAVAGRDTLASTPRVGAEVRVLSQTLVAAPGGGADSLRGEEKEVARGTTGADGTARFGPLPSSRYRIEATSGGESASVSIGPPYVADVHVGLILRPSSGG
jgi:hypothetical protein